MITMHEWMELVDYKITEGSDYYAFGPNTYSLNSWNNKHDGYSFEIVFDTKTHTVYQVEACDYKRNRAYRLVNAQYKDQVHANEQAWDDVNWTDLEIDEDFVEKVRAIKSGQEYDTGIMVSLDLSDDVILEAALQAHRRGITLNDYINQALADFVKSVDLSKAANPELVGPADC